MTAIHAGQGGKSMARKFRWLIVPLCFCLAFSFSPVRAEEALEDAPPLSLSSPSVCLMEAETGAVIFEKNAREKRPAASIAKLMTALLLMEKMENKQFSLEDQVTVSSFAAERPGSQAFLDAGKKYPLKELFKSLVIASANDSAAALAEFAAGSEGAFVSWMNERAASLGLSNTHYENCTGLPAENQYTCARDVAALSREVVKHPLYLSFSSIWLDQLTHPSGRVTDLTNTNRLVRFYPGCDGLKTGSTNEAKYCLSATAEKNGMRLIAVVLGAPNSQSRFDEARAMLDYGFSAYQLTNVAKEGDLAGVSVSVRMGARDRVDAALGKGLSLLLRAGGKDQLSFLAHLPEAVQAPVKKGDPLGEIQVLLGEKVIATLPAVAAQDVRLPGLLEGLFRLWENWK